MTVLANAAGVSGRPDTDPRHPGVRLARLLDFGTLRLMHEPDDSGVTAVRGQIAGRPVIAYCTDATVLGGTMGARGCRHIVHAIDVAVRDRVPVIGLWHSGGARLADGVESMDGVGRVFTAMVRASGHVPQLSVVLGPAAGAAVLAWPDAEVAVLGAEATGGILHRRKLAAVPEDERDQLRAHLIDEQQRLSGGVRRALGLGVVDEVIEPVQTVVRRITEALAAAPAGRGHHGNFPL